MTSQPIRDRVIGLKPHRRDVLRLAGAGFAAIAAPAIVRAQAGELTFATWGGSWEAATREAWFKPFTQKTGINVRPVPGSTPAQMMPRSTYSG